jgi:hypothetical protein
VTRITPQDVEAIVALVPDLSAGWPRGDVYAKHENKNYEPGITPYDGYLLERSQLSIDKPDLTLRQSSAKASADAR